MNTKHTPNTVADRAAITHRVSSECWSRADFDRAEACVNALAGIADPEAAIKAAREIMSAILDGHAPTVLECTKRTKLRAALALLGGA